MKGAVGGRLDVARAISRGLLAFAVLAGMCAPLLDPRPRNGVWAHAAAIVGYTALERLVSRRWPGRSISLLRIILFMAASQPFFLIIALFIQGDAIYATGGGWFSHADGAWLVALAGVLLHTGALVGAGFAAGTRGASVPAVVGIGASFSQTFYRLVSWIILMISGARMILLFFPRDVPLEVGYALRVFLGLFLGVFIVLGMALRLRVHLAQLAAVVALLVSAVVLLAGSRSEALFPPFFMAIGYVLARPVRPGQLLRWVAVAVPLFLFSMFIGSLVRQDDRGRTGEAFLGRVDNLSSIRELGRDESFISDSVVRRMVSDSTHSVITRIPRERPFEDGGLTNLPGEFVDRMLPRLNLAGISETELPRNWMLNDLGFLVNWGTSVELGLVADAWYRGGFPGLLVVGFLLGLSFQLAEDAIYRAMRRRPQVSVLLIFGVTGLMLVQARDIVAAVRGMIFLAGAGLVMVGAAMLLEARRRRPRPLAQQVVRKPLRAAST